MSNHRNKFIKTIPLPNGDTLIRDGEGTWNYHYSGGKPERRAINEKQAAMIDAAIEATFVHVHKAQS